jgi:hypothetical protein
VKAARAAAHDAEDALEAAEEALQALTAQLKDAQSSEALASLRVTEAVRNVVRADPAVEKLIEDFSSTLTQLVNLRLALDAVASLDALPEERRFCRHVPHFLTTHVTDDRQCQSCQGGERWGAALRALERDADAPLPN